MEESKKKTYRWIIIVLSVVIPVAVALLFRVKVDGYDLTFLPGIYAAINGLTAVILILARLAIKKGNRERHQKLIYTSLVFSALFLVMYVAYHITSEATTYGGEGPVRYIYFFILITHIFLSVAVVPLVLFTLLRALTGEFDRHRKLAKITFPVWLYVAASGVVVYLMISPYYT